MDYDEFANMQQALDAIIDSAFKLWEQTGDFTFAVNSTAQRFGLVSEHVRALLVQHLAEYGYEYVEA